MQVATDLRWIFCLPALLALIGCIAAPAQENSGAKRDFGTDPPVAAKVTATMLPKPIDAGNARVEVVFERHEVLPPRIPIQLETGRYLLRDDGLSGDRVAGDRTYSAIVPLDLKAIEREQQRVRGLQAQHGRLVMPIYQGRRLVRRLALPESFFTPVQSGVAFSLDWWGFDVAIDPARSLVIRDPSVVEDPSRTFDPCTGAGTPMGKWTFGFLLSQIANQAQTGIDPAEFARQWRERMLTQQSVNGWNVLASIGVQGKLNAWPTLPGTQTLDLVNAPFKLLAIVNRVDLRDNLVYGRANAGEARFVFGFRGCPGTAPGPEKLTVILEYGIRQPGCMALKNWAQQWTALAAHGLGTPAYNAALESITDQFSLAGAAPGRPNGSALNQLRTNGGEPGGTHWDFKEFRLAVDRSGASHLLLTTVKQTPAQEILSSPYPNPNALAQYVNANEAAILADDHVVPNVFMGQPFLGGSSTRTAGGFGWDSVLITNREARHKFALQTCNGCHLLETGTTVIPQEFFHIAPAATGVAASLSGFMTGIDVADPFDGSPTRQFNELQRRAVDLDALANGICLKGLDTSLRKQVPLEFPH
jgi:hypothetical protein